MRTTTRWVKRRTKNLVFCSECTASIVWNKMWEAKFDDYYQNSTSGKRICPDCYEQILADPATQQSEQQACGAVNINECLAMLVSLWEHDMWERDNAAVITVIAQAKQLLKEVPVETEGIKV